MVRHRRVPRLPADWIGFLRSTSPFLAQEGVELLCADRPPFGLRGESNQLEALWAKLNASVEVANRSRDTLCGLIAAQVRQRSASLASASYGNCAVVGSGGGLRGNGHGKAINGADAIFRFNAAPVARFARDVGSRTTLVRRISPLRIAQSR